jgi:hypothetical protein
MWMEREMSLSLLRAIEVAGDQDHGLFADQGPQLGVNLSHALHASRDKAMATYSQGQALQTPLRCLILGLDLGKQAGHFGPVSTGLLFGCGHSQLLLSSYDTSQQLAPLCSPTHP